MKAAVFKALGTPLVIEELPDPVLGTGEVIVDVVATAVLSYMDEVLSGKRKYLMTLPMAPGAGAIGRIRALGPDATRLKIGEWVLCDPTVRSRDDARTPDITLLGLSARRRRLEAAGALPPRRVGGADAASDRERLSARRDRRGGCGDVVRARPVSRALWRASR